MTPERYHRLLQVLNKRQNNLAVVLENVFDPHNISAVMRSDAAYRYLCAEQQDSRHKKWEQSSSVPRNGLQYTSLLMQDCFTY